MSVRLGVELTSSRCSLIAVEGAEDGSIVRDFHSIEYGPGDPSELYQELRRLVVARRFPQAAKVVLWDARAVHVTMAAPAGTRNLEAYAVAEAKRQIPAFQTWASNAWAGTASGRAFDMTDGGPGRELLFAAMAAEDVRRQLKPFYRAGFAIDGVSTPVLTLAGLAVTGAEASDDALTAFVAMNRDGGAVAIVRGGHLLIERRVTWDFRVDQAGVERRVAERYSFAARVATELRPVFDEARTLAGVPVVDVVAFGDLPNLRSIAMPLIDELDVEVETLDSLVGIDDSRLPERADLFRELIPSLRLAWAAAAASPLITLTAPVRWEPLSRRGARVALGGMAAAAAVVAAVALWPEAIVDPYVGGAPIGEAGQPVDPRLGLAPTTGARSSASPTGPGDVEVPAGLGGRRSPSAARRADDAGVRARVDGDRVLPPDKIDPSGADPGPTVGLDRATESAAVPSVVRDAEILGRPSVDDDARFRLGTTEQALEASAPGSTGPAEPDSVTARRDLRPLSNDLVASVDTPIADREPGGIDEPSQEPAAAVAPEAPVVRSILYSRDRRLAIIGRQVVGIGDVVERSVVTEITPNEVVLRLPNGQEQRLALHYGSRDELR